MPNFQIATLFGVPLRLNATFAVPFVLVAWVLTFEVYPQLLPRGATCTPVFRSMGRGSRSTCAIKKTTSGSGTWPASR